MKPVYLKLVFLTLNRKKMLYFLKCYQDEEYKNIGSMFRKNISKLNRPLH